MIKVDKKISCSGLAALILLSMTGMVYAQIIQLHEELAEGALKNPRLGAGILMRQEGGPPKHAPMITFLSGGGFALKDNESHILRLHVENLMPVEPMHIRRLLASNRSIEEIREEVCAIQGDKIFRGNLKLDERIYPMVDIKIAFSGENSTTLDADIVEPPIEPAISNVAGIVGHITLTIAKSGNDVIGKGKFIINKGQQIDSYQVLLDIFPSQNVGRA